MIKNIQSLMDKSKNFAKDYQNQNIMKSLL